MGEALKPPFTYFGGKTALARRFVALLPPHEHYVEPFAGSLSVLLAKPPSRMETVNDLDGDLMNFWRVLRDRPAELERVCALTPHSRADHQAAFEPTGDELERARRVWVRLTQGRSNLTSRRTGWRYFENPGTPPNAASSMPGYLAGYVSRFASVAERLIQVSLECLPALDLIAKYGRHSNVLIYADPPYLGSLRTWGNNYAVEMRGDEEHRELLEALLSCRAAVVLSGYASELYDGLLTTWFRREIATQTGNGGSDRARIEVLWSNRPFPQGSLFDQEASLPPHTPARHSAGGSQGSRAQGPADNKPEGTHYLMSIKSKVLAASAVLALAAAPAAATWTAASAATPSCGSGCIDVFSRELGTHFRPAFVMDVQRQSALVGQPLILWRQSNSDPAEDFTVSFQGVVSDFYAAGLVSSAVNLHYGGASLGAPDEPAFEAEYSPYGVASGLCVGVARTAFQNERVTLQPCGVTSKTVWILDTFDQPFTFFLQHYAPVINGSDTNFSHPFVLTYPGNGFPTDSPRPRLKVTNLTGFSNGFGPIVGTVPDTQMWGADFGVLP